MLKSCLPVLLQLVLVFSFNLIYSSCDQKPESSKEQTEIKQESSLPKAPKRYPQNSDDIQMVSRHHQPMLHFVNEMMPQIEKQGRIEDLISTEPEFSFQATILRNHIKIVPLKPLNSGQLYRIFWKKSLLKQESTTNPLLIQIIPKESRLELSGLRTLDDDFYIFRGKIRTSDGYHHHDVMEKFSVKVDGVQQELIWDRLNHEDSRASTSFPFHLKIPKKDQSQKLRATLITDSDAIVETMDIPPPFQFNVISAISTNNDRQFVTVYFNQKVKKSQNLEGLIELGSSEISTRIKDNSITIYPKHPIQGPVTLKILPGILNLKDKPSQLTWTNQLFFAERKPAVRFVGKGQIASNYTGSVLVPFEGANIKSVQVTAFLIKGTNMGRFFQDNGMDGTSSLMRTGRHIWRKTFPVSQNKRNQWNRYELDLKDLFAKQPGALYRIQLSINKSNVIYDCPSTNNADDLEEAPYKNYNFLNDTTKSNWDSYQQQNNKLWRSRHDPCKNGYYIHNKLAKDAKNILSSNMALIAKQSHNNQYLVVANTIDTAEPIAGVKIKAFNFQSEQMTETETDANGIATFKSDYPPHYLVAKKSEDIAYLKISPGLALSTSHFEVDGGAATDGMDGFLFTERGVRRPGDTIHIGFILRQENQIIPEGYPVSIELKDPRGKVVDTDRGNAGKFGMYRFSLATSEGDLTGTWTVKATAGNASFSKAIKVATIRPNRLSIQLKQNDTEINTLAKDKPLLLMSQWLHGAKAPNLSAIVEATFTGKTTRFASHKDYSFDDALYKDMKIKKTILKGQLDQDGRLQAAPNIPSFSNAPGHLTAQLKSKVEEGPGLFSTSTQTVTFKPFKYYVGIKAPPGDKARGMLLTDQPHKLSIVVMDEDGQPVSNQSVDVELFKIQWRWWWEKGAESLARYRSRYARSQIASTSILSQKTGSAWEFEVKYPDWGRYLIRACVHASGHCATQTVYIDWPGWAGRARESSGGNSAATLSVSLNKDKFISSETAIISVPDGIQGRALVSLENDLGVFQTLWHDFKEDNPLKIPLKPEYAPNIYASVTLIQAHKNKDNDRPLRMFGIIPILVQNPESVLRPQITSPEIISPNSKATILIKEVNQQPMTYMIMMVEEGLLGLTQFKSPNPHNHFYRKRALKTLTWDAYDGIIGNYRGALETLLAIGGGEASSADTSQTQNRRFPPVVSVTGPFELEAGAEGSHQIEIPNYMGAVRFMVVAANEGSFGHTETKATVTRPIVILPSLPKVIHDSARLNIPVAVFANEDDIGPVEVSMQYTTKGQPPVVVTKELNFQIQEEKTIYFALDTAPITSDTTFMFTARSKHIGDNITVSSNLIKAPLTHPSSSSRYFALEPGDQWTGPINLDGAKGTNRLFAEFSIYPPLNLSSRLDYLIRYPYGCVEQTVSSAFPQLYLPALQSLSKEQNEAIQSHINAAISRLSRYQNQTGNFNYWPGTNHYHSWSSIYVGHFLIEAKKQGYMLPRGMLNRWIVAESLKADQFKAKNHRLTQAYRLYVLAAAGQVNLAAMNRLKSKSDISQLSKWLLAAAYHLAGQEEIARLLAPVDTKDLAQPSDARDTFSSPTRNLALALDAITALDLKGHQGELMETLSESLSSNGQENTQGLAFALSSLGKLYLSKANTFAVNQGSVTVKSKKKDQKITVASSIHRELILKKDNWTDNLELTNQTDTKLYVTLTHNKQPKPGEESAEANGILLSKRYLNASNKPIDLSALNKGDEILTEITIKNISGQPIKHLALKQIAPVGWEILDDIKTKGSLEYSDSRDDRFHAFFNLKSGRSITITTKTQVVFTGRYYLPGISVEAMYDPLYYARDQGVFVSVLN